jgi:hypothetical protein
MPLRRWSGLLTAAALLVAAWWAVALTAPPPLPRGERAQTDFSAERAWRHILAIADSPRPVGTRAHAGARSYVISELESLGLEVDTLTALSHVQRGDVVRSALTRNVVALLPGTASTGAVLLTAHYDGVPLSPAAGDDGIGVATVLETARAQVASGPLRNDLIFLLTDAEELGLLGARAFAGSHPWMADVAFVGGFEARGMSGPVVMFETGPGSDRAVRAWARGGRRPVSSSIIPAVYGRMPNDTDFSVFRDRGLPGLNFAIGGSAQWYHTPGDNPGNLSPASLQHMGDNALAVARWAGEVDLGAGATGRRWSAMVGGGADRVYFHVPGVGLLGYGSGRVVPLAVLLVVAFVGAVVLAARRARLRWWGIPVGLVVAIVALVVAVILARLLWSAVGEQHSEWGALPGRALYREWPYTLGVVALTVAVMTAPFALLRRWIGLDGLALGALLLPVAGAVAAAFLLPAGSYVLLWPSLAALAMVALRGGADRGAGGTGGTVGSEPAGAAKGDGGPVSPWRSRRRDAWRWALMGAAALVVVLFMAPVLYIVHLMLGMPASAVLAVIAGVMVILLLPLLDWISWPHRAWLPAAGLLTAAALVALGLAGVTPGEDRPMPGNVIHVQDNVTGTALWAAPADHENAFTARFVAGSPDTVGLGEYSVMLRSGDYRVAAAATWEAEPTRFSVLGDVEEAGVRRVRLRLSWDDPPMVVEVRPREATTRLLAPAGSAWGAADAEGVRAPASGRWLLERWGLDWPLELVVETPAGEPLELTFTARYPGLPALAGGDRPVRPPDVMAVPAYRYAPTLSDTRLVRESVSF